MMSLFPQTTLALLSTVVFALPASVASAEDLSSGAKGLLPEATHGGQLVEGKLFNLEMVSEGGQIRLYPLSRMGSPIPPADLKLNATLKNSTQQKKRKSLKFAPKQDHFAAELKNGMNASFQELEVRATARGEKDRFLFKLSK